MKWNGSGVEGGREGKKSASVYRKERKLARKKKV